MRSFPRRVRTFLRVARGVATSPRSFVRDLRILLGRYAARGGGVAYLPETSHVTRSLPFRVGSDEPHLNVMVPGLADWALTGGPNTAIALALRLARNGLPVRLVSTDVPADEPEELWRHFRTLLDVDRLDNVSIADATKAPVAIGRDDVFLATAWWTVHGLKEMLAATSAREFLYLIQDFEPGFYPWSTSYAFALQTYAFPFRAIVNERMLLDHFVERRIGRFGEAGFADTAAVFEPAVDERHFYPEPRPDGRRLRLLFYARPSAPRNLFEIGLDALRAAAAAGVLDGWELLAMGEKIGTIRLSRDVVLKSAPWLSFDEYAAFVRSADLGLALMLSPHTGYPVLEFAASGVPVVTNCYSTKTRDTLAAISPAIAAAEPTVESVGAALRQSVERPRADRPTERQISLPGSWDESLEPLVPQVREIIAELRR